MRKKTIFILPVLCLLIPSVSCTGSADKPHTGTTSGLQSANEPARNAGYMSEATAAEDTKADGTSAGGEVVNIRIPAPSLANNKIEEPLSRNIIVCLPESYGQSEKSYPTVYYLTGWSEQCEKYGAEIQTDMEELVRGGKAKEMIVVILDGRNKFYGSFYVNSPVTGNWEDYVVKDVVGYIDSNFRTIKDAKSRGISGASMGGFGSINIAMHHPDVFSCVYSMSPGIFGEEAMVDTSNFDLSQALTDEYRDMTKEEAHKAYMEKIRTADRDTLHSLGFNSAFAPEPDGKAPYIMTIKGNAVEDKPVLKLMSSGLGGWDEKVVQYRDNLKKLKAIHLEYGKLDEYAWIPVGCEHLSGVLKKEGIDHSLAFYLGTHTNKVSIRIKELLLPFFSNRLEFE